jgi:PST family polysaccharide transporter
MIMTRFLDPDEVGEVSVATIICFSVTWATNFGWGQYLVIHGRGDAAKEVGWHATLGYVAVGVVTLGLIAVVGGGLTPLLGAPGAALYLPGMALAMWIRRLGMAPERTLTMKMTFRASGLSLFAGESTYTVVALACAWRGYGGMSIVYGNIAQSAIMSAILLAAANWRDWGTPMWPRWERVKSFLGFGWPIAVSSVAHGGSRYWDNLTVSTFFGPGATGVYNMAYNLADIPAIQIGEQIQLVLMPSITELPVDQRGRAAERSAALMSLLLFPLAIGLGLVAKPLIALVLPADQWQEVAPLLVVLSGLSVFRPFLSVLAAYMEASGKTGRLMGLELAKLVVLLGGIAGFAMLGTNVLDWSEMSTLQLAAGAVGFAFGLTALTTALLVSREPGGPRMRPILKGFFEPLLACGVMTAAVLAAEHGLALAGVTHPGVVLVVAIVVGAVSYAAAALVIARDCSRDLLQLLKKTLRRGG